VYCHVSHPLTILQTAAAATTAATAATNDDNKGESVGNSEGEDDEDNEGLLSDMGPKKVPAAAAAAAAPKKAPAKSGNVDALADLLQGATETKGVAKKPAFTSYSTKVQDPFLIRTVFVDGDISTKFLRAHLPAQSYQPKIGSPLSFIRRICTCTLSRHASHHGVALWRDVCC